MSDAKGFVDCVKLDTPSAAELGIQILGNNKATKQEQLIMSFITQVLRSLSPDDPDAASPIQGVSGPPVPDQD